MAEVVGKLAGGKGAEGDGVTRVLADDAKVFPLVVVSMEV
jgi:hypothetical protein